MSSHTFPVTLYFSKIVSMTPHTEPLSASRCIIFVQDENQRDHNAGLVSTTF